MKLCTSRTAWMVRSLKLRSDQFCSSYQYPKHLKWAPQRHQTSYGVRGLQFRRTFSLSTIPTALLPPVVFGGLLVTLWTYKCLMMVVFQNKIIYMPSMPPFSRSEKVEDYVSQCWPVTWNEHAFRSLDGTKLYCLEGAIPSEAPSSKQIVILYFQGNGSSLPPRLPSLSNVLRSLRQEDKSTQFTILALSYRGYWKSSGRPSQRGIELDAQAFLQWAREKYVRMSQVEFVLWGQSIGAGVATTALATSLKQSITTATRVPVRGLLLETPFTSLRAMLLALYPQKFLPYRYLGPFLLSTWDSDQALRTIGHITDQTWPVTYEMHEQYLNLKVLLLEAADDELVPRGEAAKLVSICKQFARIDVKHAVVPGAFHTNVMTKGKGRQEIRNFVLDIGKEQEPSSPIRT